MVCRILNPEQGVCPLWPSDFLFAIADVLRWWPSACHHRSHQVIAMPSRDVLDTAGCPCCKQTGKPRCSIACEEMRETRKHAEQPRHAGQKYMDVQAQVCMYAMLKHAHLIASWLPVRPATSETLTCGARQHTATQAVAISRSVTPCAREYCYCWPASPESFQLHYPLLETLSKRSREDVQAAT